MDQQTPSFTLYTDLKAFGRIRYVDAAEMLLSNRPVYGGVSPRDRIGEKTFLSREVVHAAPGALPESFFADFSTSVLNVAARIAGNLKGAGQRGSRVPGPDAQVTSLYWGIRDHYLGPASADMRQALLSCGQDDRLYANAVGNVKSMTLRREEDRAVLGLMLFVITGCLGSPERAVQLTEDFVKKTLATDFRTNDLESLAAVHEGDAHMRGRSAPGLGLARMINGAMRPHVYPLSTDPAGTIIGSLATGASRIIDVGQSVSRSHLHIWLDEDQDLWFCQGLGSTNGTLLRTAAGKVVEVEAPRAKRAGAAGAIAPPVAFGPGDYLQLGSDTVFLAVPISLE